MTGGLVGARIEVSLPVTLSRATCRDALVRTGWKPDPDQVLEINDLTELDVPERERVVDLWERIDVQFEDGLFSVRGFDLLRQGVDGWHVATSAEESVDLHSVFFASPGRTLRLTEWLGGQLDDDEELWALLNGAPVVRDLATPELTLEPVLDAYGRALELGRRLAELVTEGERADAGWWFRSGTFVNDDLVVFESSEVGGPPPVGFLRKSDPKAFQEVRDHLEAVRATSEKLETKFADTVVAQVRRVRQTARVFTDAELVRNTVAAAVEMTEQEHATDQAKADRQGEYQAERQRWIAQHASRRLRLAAERGYRHDGLYRDERLAEELPSFVALGKQDEVKELLNPTEEALELESDVLQHIVDRELGDLEVKLVWVTSSFKSAAWDGEHVQIRSFLGRHNVYRPVHDRPVDDIPFDRL